MKKDYVHDWKIYVKTTKNNAEYDKKEMLINEDKLSEQLTYEEI